MMTKRRIIAAKTMCLGVITSALTGAETTLYVDDTTGWPTSGTGVIRDSTNDNDVFTWAGKTSTTLTGVAGSGGNAVLAHKAGALICSEDITTKLDATYSKLLPFDVKVAPNIKMNKRNPARNTLSKMASLPGSQLATVSFRAEVKGAGSAYSASVSPAIAPYLKACGYAETIDATPGSEKATYAPTSVRTSMPAMMIDVYEDGVVKRIYGARGNVRFTGKAGEPIYAEFEFTGVWNGMVDAAMLSVTSEATIPPVFLSGDFSVASYAAVIQGFEASLNTVLAVREDPNIATGYREAIITDRNPGGKFDPEITTVAVYDWHGKWKAGTSGALNIGNVGSTQYNRFKITAPTLIYTQISDADREGVAIADCSFELASGGSGDDELVIEFN